MVVIIKLVNNIISVINVQEFRLRFVSTTILSLLFLAVFLLGNPFVSIFFSILLSFVFFEYEKLNSKILKKSQVFKTLFFQTILLIFTFLEIHEIEINLLFSNNYLTFVFISVFFNTFFLFLKRSNFINFILSNLIIFSFFLPYSYFTEI